MMRARVFQHEGNRFLIPGLWYAVGDPDWKGKSHTEILCDSVLLSLSSGMDIHDEWLELEASPEGKAEIPHVCCRLNARGFERGPIDVYLIGGPMFDEAINKERNETND